MDIAKLRADEIESLRTLVEENDRLSAALIDARLFVGAVAGENQPAREWAVALRDRIDAALARRINGDDR